MTESDEIVRLAEKAVREAELEHGPESLEVAHRLDTLVLLLKSRPDRAWEAKEIEERIRVIKSVLTDQSYESVDRLSLDEISSARRRAKSTVEDCHDEGRTETSLSRLARSRKRQPYDEQKEKLAEFKRLLNAAERESQNHNFEGAESLFVFARAQSETLGDLQKAAALRSYSEHLKRSKNRLLEAANMSAQADLLDGGSGTFEARDKVKETALRESRVTLYFLLGVVLPGSSHFALGKFKRGTALFFFWLVMTCLGGVTYSGIVYLIIWADLFNLLSGRKNLLDMIFTDQSATVRAAVLALCLAAPISASLLSPRPANPVASKRVNSAHAEVHKDVAEALECLRKGDSESARTKIEKAYSKARGTGNSKLIDSVDATRSYIHSM